MPSYSLADYELINVYVPEIELHGERGCLALALDRDQEAADRLQADTEYEDSQLDLEAAMAEVPPTPVYPLITG